jgi:TonB family protein
MAVIVSLRKEHSRRQRAAPRILAAAVLALLCHAITVGLIVATGAFHDFPLSRPLPFTPRDVPERPDTEEPLQIETLVERLDRKDEPTPEEEQRKKEEEQTKVDGQVVDIAKPAIEQRPDEARFLAEYDSMVQRETKGKWGRNQAGAEGPSAPVPVPQQVKPQLPGRQAPPGPVAMRGLPEPARPARDWPASMQELTPDGTAPRRPHVMREARPPGGGGQQERRAAPDLTPTPEVLQRAVGQGAGSMDYLKDIDDGEFTALNAKKWKFASFFNRVKRSVADEWHPDTVYLRHDPTGNIYGVRDRITILRVHLMPDGKLTSVQVLQPCGVDFLDDEAVGAFRRAQPFPNPPSQLVEADGQIHFNFAFIFELSGRTSFKVFKY